MLHMEPVSAEDALDLLDQQIRFLERSIDVGMDRIGDCLGHFDEADGWAPESAAETVDQAA